MGKLKAIIIPVTVFQQNCTLLYDDETKRGVLVDPGGDWSRVEQAIEQAGIKVEAIWITHAHVDHAGGAMEAKEALNVPVIGSNIADKPLMDNLVTTAKEYGMTGVRNCVPDRWLEEGDIVDCGGHSFKVFHTPGMLPVMLSISMMKPVWHSLAMCFFTIRSDEPIFPFVPMTILCLL